MIKPDYYDSFVCIGSECKNNCCRGLWDIEVDDDALRRFSRIGGEFGEKVMSSINDENVFIRKAGRCPMLNDAGLCEMVVKGHELCIVCDEYPRFTEFYDDYVERGISLSCEAAAKIILNNKEKVRFVGETGECNEDIFSLLLACRKEIIDILQNREIDVYKRIRLVLDYGDALQQRINNNIYDMFSYSPKDRAEGVGNIDSFIDVLKNLEALDESWDDILNGCSKEREIWDETVIEQLAVYFVFRYFLKGAFDYDALSKLKFMALSVISVVALAKACDGIEESARRYSIEIEHNEDNIEAIYDEFIFNDDLSTEKIINMIK